MRHKYLVIPLLLLCISCANENNQKAEGPDEAGIDSIFNKEGWITMDGLDYPYRAQMLNDVVYNDTIRSLDEYEILHLLGEPDRRNEGHFYYTISKKRIGFFPLSSRTMVIKFLNDSTIEWIKIHE